MEPKFAIITALESAREALARAQALIQDAENVVLAAWEDEARRDADAATAEEVLTHPAVAMQNASMHDEPPSHPIINPS